MAYGGSAVGSVSGGVRVVKRAAPPRFTPATSPIVRRLVIVSSAGSSAATAHIAVDVDTFQGYELDSDGLGFSLGRIVKNIGTAAKKAVVDTGHAAGAVVTSKIGQAIIGGGLALTGVGLPAAIAIGAGAQAGGNLVKKGGNLRKVGQGAILGAGEGAAAGLVGKVLKNNAGNLVDSARSKLGMGSFRPTAKTSVIPDVTPFVPSRNRLPFSKVPDLVHGEAPLPGTDIVDRAAPAVVDTALATTAVTAALGADQAKRRSKAQAKIAASDASDADKASALSKLQQGFIDEFKKAGEAITQRASDAVTGPVYSPGTGPLAAPSSDASAPAQAGMFGNIPPLALAAGVVGLFFVVNSGGSRRGRR